MSASVSLKRLVRHFSGAAAPAVDGVDLEVSAGETVCLVGPSGCGKSTTLRLVAGLDTPSSGTVVIDGRDMAGVPPRSRDVAMVFQGFALYPHLRVRQILEFPLKMRKVPGAERAAIAERTAKMLGLERLLERFPAELSGGERQRVAMGRAIVRKPKVFLFDEPLSNLDAALRIELRSELARLLRRLTATAVYVTHDQSEAMTLGHRIALMRNGRIEQIDAPRAIYERPRSEFVASFFGSPPMNLLPVACEGSTARVGDWVLPCPVHRGSLRLGIRPEHLRLAGGATAATEDAVATDAQVLSVEPLGAETHVALDVDGTRITARVAGFDAPAPNDRVRVALDPAHAHWFDGATGRAL